MAKDEKSETAKKETKMPVAVVAGTKCLLIKLTNGHSHLTGTENLGCLIEFARAYKVEILAVALKEDGLCHTLDSLIQVIAAGTFVPLPNGNMVPEHEVIETKIKGNIELVIEKSKREVIAEIHKAIREIFATTGKVSVDDVAARFPQVNRVTVANCLNRAVQKMQKEGIKIERAAPGAYVTPAPVEERPRVVKGLDWNKKPRETLPWGSYDEEGDYYTY